MRLNGAVEQRLLLRSGERVWLTYGETREGLQFDDLAVQAGLPKAGLAWVKVDVERGLQVLTALLHRDLAYGSELMPENDAKDLASQFFDYLEADDARLATNCLGIPDELPFSFDSATDYTFDAGIALIGPRRAGLYWVAEED